MEIAPSCTCIFLLGETHSPLPASTTKHKPVCTLSHINYILVLYNQNVKKNCVFLIKISGRSHPLVSDLKEFLIFPSCLNHNKKHLSN